MPANCLAPITKCAYKKPQQQIKEEAFQDGDFIQKAYQYLSSSDELENAVFLAVRSLCYCSQKFVIFRDIMGVTYLGSLLAFSATSPCPGPPPTYSYLDVASVTSDICPTVTYTCLGGYVQMDLQPTTSDTCWNHGGAAADWAANIDNICVLGKTVKGARNAGCVDVLFNGTWSQ